MITNKEKRYLRSILPKLIRSLLSTGSFKYKQRTYISWDAVDKMLSFSENLSVNDLFIDGHNYNGFFLDLDFDKVLQISIAWRYTFVSSYRLSRILDKLSGSNGRVYGNITSRLYTLNRSLTNTIRKHRCSSLVENAFNKSNVNKTRYGILAFIYKKGEENESSYCY